MMKKREGIYIIFYMRACVKILILLKTVQLYINLYISHRERVCILFFKSQRRFVHIRVSYSQ